MRVRFLKAYAGRDCAAQAEGAVIDLDYGTAARLYAEGYLVAFPRTEAEIAAAVARPEPGDDSRTPKEIADRQASLTAIIRQNDAGAESLMPAGKKKP